MPRGMNYRHIYHAGNFADVLKHAVLARVITLLQRKEKPLRVIDTHAGAGRYRLTSTLAEKTGEWSQGIAALDAAIAALPEDAIVRELLGPYLRTVQEDNRGGTIKVYPGSPLVARRLLRPDDRLVANELHPDDHRRLADQFAGDTQVIVRNDDGWIALKASLPPQERRGVILIDPPFEERGELARLEQALSTAVARFATGVYLLWYPIKDVKPIERMAARLRTDGPPKLLRLELFIRRPINRERLNGCGMLLLNPPFGLEDDLEALMPFLRDVLGQDFGATWQKERLTGEGPR